MDFSESSHKRTLGILFIVFSVLGLFGLYFYDIFVDFIFKVADSNGDPVPTEMTWIFDLIRSILWGVAVLFLIPKIIIGVGLMNGRKWANIPSLIYGILGLMNFPVGTLVGVYSILIYTAKPKQED
ncbi:MAG: hypothetical protein ACJAZV_002457 [Roseivirga sp.]|jgi:hypothetical protein